MTIGRTASRKMEVPSDRSTGGRHPRSGRRACKGRSGPGRLRFGLSGVGRRCDSDGVAAESEGEPNVNVEGSGFLGRVALVAHGAHHIW